jgi:hypothetical protein
VFLCGSLYGEARGVGVAPSPSSRSSTAHFFGASPQSKLGPGQIQASRIASFCLPFWLTYKTKKKEMEKREKKTWQMKKKKRAFPGSLLLAKQKASSIHHRSILQVN